MTVNSELQHVKEWSQMRGFSNLFRKENRAWWGTRRWWVNALLWTVILCGLMGILLFGPNNELQEASANEIAAAGGEQAFVMEIGLNIFFQFGVAATAIGTIILAQDLIIAEKQNGLTEWLLSKPVKRRSYVLAKLAANTLPMLLWLIGLPSVVAYGLLSLRMGAAFPMLPFLAGVGIMAIHTFFYLTLTLMLGTFFNSRGPILGLALGSVLGGGMIGGFIKPLLTITPWMLPKVATLTASGQTLPPEVGIIPIVATALWSVVFVAVAIMRFEKTEF